MKVSRNLYPALVLAAVSGIEVLSVPRGRIRVLCPEAVVDIVLAGPSLVYPRDTGGLEHGREKFLSGYRLHLGEGPLTLTTRQCRKCRNCRNYVKVS